MPILKFQCQSCGLLQRKRVPTQKESIDCSCGEKAFLEGSTPNSSVGFSADVEGTMRVQTSGIESFDLNFDRVIGEESKQRWDTIYQRRKDKWDIIHSNEGTNGYDIMRLPDGHYESLPKQAKMFRDAREENMSKLKSQNKSVKE
jgi:hypothetical protein